jgi:hypothetical protein
VGDVWHHAVALEKMEKAIDYGVDVALFRWRTSRKPLELRRWMAVCRSMPNALFMNLKAVWSSSSFYF